MRYVALIWIVIGSAVWAEPSVYSNAGSYGSAKKNHSAILSLQEEVAQLKQEVEGLKSIVEGLGMTLNQAQQKEASSGSRTDSKLLHDLSVMIDKINSTYVSKEALRKALKSGKVANRNSSARKIPKKRDKAKADSGSKLEKADSSALYSRGVRLVKKKKYSMAKQRFDILKTRGYKKSSTYFYLGEIAYRTKKYADAIAYYKTSAGANENANYMDTLLLHTGISLEKRGDKSQAKRFFQAIVDGYPNTGSAKVAKRHL